MVEELVKETISMAKIALRGEPISPSNLLIVVVAAIEAAEKYRLNGPAKKVIVIEAIGAVIDETVADDSIAMFIKALLPATIDTAIALTKGTFDINAAKKGCLCW